MIQDSFKAMGTTIEVVATSESDVEATRNHFETAESRFSRFRADSELSIINTTPGRIVEVSAEMASVLALAKALQTQTCGLVDPALGAAVVGWGYDRTFDEIGEKSTRPSGLTKGRWTIDRQTLKRESGTLLDLGGIVKGWAADQAVEKSLALVVSAGGDVRSALSDTEVGVVHDFDDTTVNVNLGCRGLATSSVARRRWLAGGQEAHHIIDPNTLAPARSPLLSATAMSETAASAEAAAKAIILLGEDGLSWAAEQSWVDAAMVGWHDGSILSTHGWEFAA